MQTTDLKQMDIVEAGHVTEVYGPVQALRNFLIKRGGRFEYIAHPFVFTGIAGTSVTQYEDGRVVEEKKGHKRGNSQPLQWARDFWFNIAYLASRKGRADVFIGVDPLNALGGIIMKFFGKTDRVVYYVIDHMDRRFANPVFNFVYELIDGLACAGSDSIWCLSERMAAAKNKKHRFDKSKNIVVPVGIELDEVDRFTVEEKTAKKTMVLMSMLDATKGVQMLIDAMTDIIKEVPEAEMLVIGTGPYEKNLKEQAKSLGLEKSVKFLGVMEHGPLFKFIPHHRIGLAPYMDDKNNYTYYADPTKPKEYLGCGLPVVITDVPWIAEEVAKRPMGVVCKYNKEELAKACVKLLRDDAFYTLCLKNAIDFASGFSWDRIYSEAFEKVLKIK